MAMAEKTPVIYVWSSSDEERYNRYQNAIRWMLVPIILLGLLMLGWTVWALIEFRSCAWKLAPPTAGFPILIVFLIMALLIITLGGHGLVIFTREQPNPLKHFIRTALLFVIVSVMMMIILWIYTTYNQDEKYKRENMQLAYFCLKEVSDCWDNVQKIHDCCGWDSPQDWGVIPISCCDFSHDYSEMLCHKNQTSIPIEMAHREGCRNHLSYRSFIYILTTGISWAITVILTLAVIFLGIHLLRGLKIKEKLRPLLD